MSTTTSKALATTDPRSLQVTGAFRDPNEVTTRLQHAAKNYHLVSPATVCAVLPQGMSVAMSTVLVDVENETYDVGGKRGLGKTALDKIASAAGISWDARMSGRLDDGSDPHYVAWRAVGRVRHLDGTIVQIVGTKEMDLRQGSAQVEALWERYESKHAKWQKDKRGYEPKEPTGQIREMRLHIVAHAESKARLRAIRSLGIRAAYEARELERPFVIARVMWTGESDDPELRRLFALEQAKAMLHGERALYGDSAPMQAAPVAPLPPANGMSALGGKRPPPVGSAEEADDLDRMDAIPAPAPPPSEPKSNRNGATAPAPNATPAPTAKAEPATEAPARSGGGPVCRFGKQKDMPLADLDDDDLEWYRGAVKKSVDDPEKSRFKASNEKHYREVLAEIEQRNGVPADGEDTDRGDSADAY